MRKILVANRGEIALRVMRTAREMGIQTVAIFSELDRLSPHVLFADEAVCIGPAPSAESYLLGSKIVEIAKQLKVEGIHPGYGFLSENAAFAQEVENAGIRFIGPTPEAIAIMGDKLKAKEAVAAFNVPQVPGSGQAITDVPAAKELAAEIGFPVLIKAAAGGGGKGMRVVYKLEEFENAMNRAVSEAVNAFGDGRVFIEKYVTSPRHIEFQIIADTHGNVLHLFERECSVQRRHQKVIEEAPSAVLTSEIREKMGQTAINVAKSCNYRGAGTVEFILDEDLNFYFLEMNTRLQVEHPVTEQITGVDLVRTQIEIARGAKIPFEQADLSITGHAIEVRVYAEDPENNFLPDTGTLELYQKPEGPGIRVDDGYREGMEIPIYYDPMIAKLVATAATREQSIERCKRAIDEYKIKGIKTTLPFGAFVMNHPDFISGNFDTHFVQKHFDGIFETSRTEDAETMAGLAALLKPEPVQREQSPQTAEVKSKWKLNRSA